MCNVEIYGFKDEDAVIKAIHEALLKLGFDSSNAFITVMCNREVEDYFEEGICLVGYDIDKAEVSSEADRLPIGTHLVDSCSMSIGSDSGIIPYVSVFAHSPERLDEMVQELKSRKIRMDTEKHLITPPKEYEYPCVRVLASEEEILAKVASVMEQLSFKTYKKLIGFEPASAMR